jgi:phosphoribosyl-ATP pyrophosphohydrolase/phosphoribosyl-AMP cyclohydrolase
MKPEFAKYTDLLIPAIIQDEQTGRVLMLGYMNEKALQLTEETGKVTFYSRSKQRIWTKGESSGNFLYLKEILMDCDADCLLIKARPAGPVCHSGSDTCFNEINPAFNLAKLESVIKDRKDQPAEQSYTASLFAKGINKIAQKVGEEAVELVIESKDDNKEKFLGEAADLLFHYLVLLQAKGSNLEEVIKTLAVRHK